MWRRDYTAILWVWRRCLLGPISRPQIFFSAVTNVTAPAHVHCSGFLTKVRRSRRICFGPLTVWRISKCCCYTGCLLPCPLNSKQLLSLWSNQELTFKQRRFHHVFERTADYPATKHARREPTPWWPDQPEQFLAMPFWQQPCNDDSLTPCTVWLFTKAKDWTSNYYRVITGVQPHSWRTKGAKAGPPWTPASGSI